MRWRTAPVRRVVSTPVGCGPPWYTRRVTLHEPTSPETERRPGPGPPEGGAAQGRVVVVFHPRSILTALGVVLAVVAAVEFMLLAQAGLTLVIEDHGPMRHPPRLMLRLPDRSRRAPIASSRQDARSFRVW
jgi:hypothetical protein